jgi:hypothetical protein
MRIFEHKFFLQCFNIFRNFIKYICKELKGTKIYSNEFFNHLIILKIFMPIIQILCVVFNVDIYLDAIKKFQIRVDICK